MAKWPPRFHNCVEALACRLFPDRCVLCGDAAAIGRFCVSCRLDLPRPGPACSRCAEPLAACSSGADVCGHCLQRPPPFGIARAPLRYDFPVDSALKALKFRHQLHYAPAFAELLIGELLLHFEDADALAPVPLHPLRHARRGFNQAVELCRPLARMSGLPIAANLRRIRRTEPQSGLSGEARRRNLKNAFAVLGPLRCRRPVIVDDVMTTGETCRQLAATLLDAGADSVRVLTVARASSR